MHIVDSVDVLQEGPTLESVTRHMTDDPAIMGVGVSDDDYDSMVFRGEDPSKGLECNGRHIYIMSMPSNIFSIRSGTGIPLDRTQKEVEADLENYGFNDRYGLNL